MKRAAAISIGLATLLLAIGYGLDGHWIGVAASVALGCLWLVGLWRGWHGTDALGLVGFVSLAAVGVWLMLAAPILLVSVVAALAAWDAQRFAQRLWEAEHVRGETELVRSHLQRLFWVCGSGCVLGEIALGVRVPLGFTWALLLGALAIVGLSRAIRWLNRSL
jgi:hypothetical protein